MKALHQKKALPSKDAPNGLWASARRNTRIELVWQRGESHVNRNGFIVLDTARAESYNPTEQSLAWKERLLKDFAALNSVRAAQDFVRAYGLLRVSAPIATCSESLEEMKREAREFAMVLGVYTLLQLRDYKGLSILRALWEHETWENMVVASPAFMAPSSLSLLHSETTNAALTDEQLIIKVSTALAQRIEQGLEGTTVGFGSGEGNGSGNGVFATQEFGYVLHPRDLLSYAYHLMCTVITDSTETKLCASCDKPFFVQDQHQRYCTPQCAGSARQRKFKARHSQALG